MVWLPMNGMVAVGSLRLGKAGSMARQITAHRDGTSLSDNVTIEVDEADETIYHVWYTEDGLPESVVVKFSTNGKDGGVTPATLAAILVDWLEKNRDSVPGFSDIIYHADSALVLLKKYAAESDYSSRGHHD